MERAAAGEGACVVRVVPDCSAGSYRRFGHDHLCHSSRVRTDRWNGSASGLSSFAGLEQRPFDAGDWDASLPMCHRVISNFKAWVQGNFHGLPADRLQSYADELGWRYSHRSSPDAPLDLLRAALAGHVRREDIPQTATVQPPLDSTRRTQEQRL